MPNILITGNGFDLSFGLPTAYSHFITILNEIKNNASIDYEFIPKTTLSNNILKQHFKEFELDKTKIDLLKIEIKDNLWFNYFKNEYDLESWIDFEIKIEKILILILSSSKNLRDQVFSKQSINSTEEIEFKSILFQNNVDVMKCLEKFKIIELSEYYDIKLNKKYLIEKYNHYIDIDIKAITDDLIKELDQFKKIFNQYFEIFVTPFYDNKISHSNDNKFSKIDYHYTFNFTTTFEKIYNTQIKTSYLHGKIGGGSNSIVLGINDIPNNQIDRKYFLPFTKYFQKLNYQTNFEFISRIKKNKSLKYQFFFYGHSLDNSDKDYINEVFDFIDKSISVKIIVIYHDDNSKSKLLINLLDIRGKDNIQSLMKSQILIFRKNDSKQLLDDLNRDLIKRLYM